MNYSIYNPTITTLTAINPYNDPSGLTYVSNSSLVSYGGKYWAIMDGTTQGFVEGSVGQQVYLTTSLDAITWTPAIRPFGDALYCSNPIASSTLQWQPNLVVVGNELWCTWSGADSYISKLMSPIGLWTNYRFEFIGSNQIFISSTVSGTPTAGRATRPTINGISDWLAFPSQNPIVLSSGVVACPVTLYSSTASTQITTTNSFTRELKFNALFKSTDGNNWTMTIIDTAAYGDFCAWEPFVVEGAPGHVHVFSRSLNTLSADPDFLLDAVSSDGGVTFSPSVSTKMLVPSTRGFARKVSRSRWILTHIDHPQNSDQTPNQSLSNKVRRNGALFISRRGINDFVPGVNFSGSDSSVNYPQFIVGPDNILRVNYTSGNGVTIRRSLKIVSVSPLPDDNVAYIHPRSVNSYTTAIAPALNSAATPPYYEFNGSSQVVSVTSLAASSGVTYAGWFKWSYDGEVLMDCRSSSVTNFGQVFFLRGIAIPSLNFLHGFTLIPDSPLFMATVIDNTAGSVVTYIGNGSGSNFLTKTGYYKSILFAAQPADGETITINGVLYTFRTTVSLANDVSIGVTVNATITNLGTKLGTNSMTTAATGASRLIMTRSDTASFAVSSGSAQISVESGIPLGGGSVSFGKASVTSSLSPFDGVLYEARIYNSPLSQANVTFLHNAKAALFSYSDISGTSTSPGSPFLFLDPANPNPTEFPISGNLGASCEIVSATLLRIHGEGSAAIELPYGATKIILRYKLGAVPTATDKYVIATFGTIDMPVKLYIDASNPTALYVNGKFVVSVADPTIFNNITVVVSTNKITIGSIEQLFSGKPRCFIGNAFPENLLSTTRTIDFDTSTMTATVARRAGA